MNTKHTPAPWRFDEYNGKLWITDDTGIGTIAQLIPEPDKGIWSEDIANAQLIAAAPELLAALQNIVKANANYDDLTQTLIDAEAAIANATTNS